VIPLHTAPADFVGQPTNAIDDLANSLKFSAFDLIDKVLNGFGSVGNFDPRDAAFLSQYAAAAGIGLIVMAFMTILAIVRSLRGGGSREDLQESLFKRLPLGVFLIVFAPAIGVVLSAATSGMTSGLSAWAGGDLHVVDQKVAALANVTSDMVPGGAFVGVLVFLLMVLGAFGVFLGLVVQELGLAVAGIVAGIAWGMLVHPRWRAKALRPAMTWLSLLLVKPLLFLVLGAVLSAVADPSAPNAGSGTPLLARLCAIAVALLIAGYAPFLVLRHLPDLAAGGRRDLDFGSGRRDVVGAATPITSPRLTTGQGHGADPAMGRAAGPHERGVEQAYIEGQRRRTRERANDWSSGGQPTRRTPASSLRDPANRPADPVGPDGQSLRFEQE